MAIITLTVVLTITSSNFFYNNYSIKYFMTLNGLIPIETAKNIVMFINNNAFTYTEAAVKSDGPPPMPLISHQNATSLALGVPN